MVTAVSSDQGRGNQDLSRLPCCDQSAEPLCPLAQPQPRRTWPDCVSAARTRLSSRYIKFSFTHLCGRGQPISRCSDSAVNPTATAFIKEGSGHVLKSSVMTGVCFCFFLLVVSLKQIHTFCYVMPFSHEMPKPTQFVLRLNVSFSILRGDVLLHSIGKIKPCNYSWCAALNAFSTRNCSVFKNVIWLFALKLPALFVSGDKQYYW